MSTSATSASPVSTYTISVTAGSLSAANYDFPNLVNGTLAVNKAHLTVTANTQSMLYGGSVPALTATISGFVNGDTSNVVSGTPGFGLSTSATSASPAGSYPITDAAGTLSAANYDFPNFVSGTFTVNKAHLTVTADAKSKVYGGSVPVLTAMISGFVNGETSSVVSGAPTLTAVATAASHVAGSPYPILVSAGSLWAVNYRFVFVGGTLSVTPAPLTITANGATKAYGAGLPALSARYSGFVNGDSSASLTALPTLSTTASASRAPCCPAAMPSSPRGPATPTIPSRIDLAPSSLPRPH